MKKLGKVQVAKSKAPKRDAQVTIIMARNGTGKSTLVKTIADHVGGRIVVVTMNGMPEIWRSYLVIDASDPAAWSFKSGIRQVWYLKHDKDTFKWIHKYFHDGLLILDDCRNYVSANLDNDHYMKRLMIDFRHKMMDIFLVVHSPGQVPKQVWTFYSSAWIGATDALLNKNIGIDSAERIIGAQKRVNALYRAAIQKNDGSHYGIFEHIQP
jgi:hypothetical protein